jgi:hypothetical protein
MEGASCDEEGGASPSPTETAWRGTFPCCAYITKEETITDTAAIHPQLLDGHTLRSGLLTRR